MSGRLTVNYVEDCKDLTIIMDDATITGNFDDVAINQLKNVARANISMRNLTVKSSEGAVPDSGACGSLSINRIDRSKDTKINQDGMQISGKFDEIRVNDIKNSARTTVSMRGGAINARNSSSESDDENSDSTYEDVKRKQHSKGDYDNEAKTQVAEEFRLYIDMPGTGSATCTFSKTDLVKDVIECISGSKPCPKNKKIVLQDIKSKKLLGKKYSMRLDEAGFHNEMKLRAVEIEAD